MVATLDDVIASVDSLRDAVIAIDSGGQLLSELQGLHGTVNQVESLMNGFIQVMIYGLAATALGRNKTIAKPVWWDDLMAQYGITTLEW